MSDHFLAGESMLLHTSHESLPIVGTLEPFAYLQAKRPKRAHNGDMNTQTSLPADGEEKRKAPSEPRTRGGALTSTTRIGRPCRAYCSSARARPSLRLELGVSMALVTVVGGPAAAGARVTPNRAVGFVNYDTPDPEPSTRQKSELVAFAPMLEHSWQPLAVERVTPMALTKSANPEPLTTPSSMRPIATTVVV